MFVMDFTSKSIAWFNKIGEKLENLCSEVDAKSQEQVHYVESQLQIAGANVKQFYSEIFQEIFPTSFPDAMEEETSNLSLQQNRKNQLPASEMSNISVEEDYKEELSQTNLSSLLFPVEAAEGVHIDSPLHPQADMAMKMSVEDNLEKALSSGESSEVVASDEGTLNTASLSCEYHKGVEGPSRSSAIVSLECQEVGPSMQVQKVLDCTALEDDTSNVPSLTCSTYSTESQESALTGVEINSCAALPAVDGASVDRPVNEQVTGSVSELEFDGDCILVDRDDLSTVSEFHGAHISYKKNMPRLKVKPRRHGNEDAISSGNLIVESELLNAECRTRSCGNKKLELSQEAFCESDWEII